MKTSRRELAAIIAERTMRATGEDLAHEIAAVLLTEKRTADLETLLRDVMQYRTEHGIVEARVTSAHPIDDAVLADAKTLLQHHYPDAKQIIVTTGHDPSVIGGLRITLSDRQLDLTLKAKLNKFKRLTALGKENI